ncbi:head maturation protease, ClpP-related [Paracoccus saliphilus]|uniref:ATP-dependent protease ClpP, protease subunit n=1 Tax=Paracoccus saliphilus TaxID=405559 RepID=A0AA46A6H4_9RHOB|nr:head maturation protease, ClpP-related [Paracoccus saliphilus]WCR01643.1 Clp protease ClpP [Paracoccus saliphilus]SIS98415.1 ATP-dependent protease ClpP, protease subunit [Paracoccus saliphilus]
MNTGSDLIFNGELILSGNVIDDSWAGWMWEEDIYFCPSKVRRALAELGEGRVTVRINSPGGHADAGEQIRTILAGHPGGCRIIVEGLAASAASLIFMAGDERLMSAGSHLMIHDPSGAFFGTEDEARRHAEMLGVVSSTYASVYAAAAGISPDKARAIMRAETWLGPQPAIDTGFADRVLDEGEAAAPQTSMLTEVRTKDQAQELYLRGRERLLMRMADHRSGERGNRPDHPSTTREQDNQKEANMADKAKTAGTPANPPAADPAHETPPAGTATMQAPAGTPAPVSAPQPAEPTRLQAPSAEDILAGERSRVRGIREMTASFVTSGRLMQAQVDELIDTGVSADAASAQVLTMLAASEAPGRSANPRSTITRDESETRMEGMIGALMGQGEGPAEQFRGMRLRHLAMELAGPGRGYNDAETIRRGMRATTMMGGAHGISDFAYVTTEVMNRSLLAAYQRRNASWQMVTGTPLTATDFRELHSVRFGGDFSLKPVQENGEYQSATLADEAEGLKVERRGRTIKLTFEAVVNDDMGAFQRIPTEFAMAARTMESAMVWSLIRNNAKLKSDGKALFHADHNNLGTAGVINAANVAKARKAMWEQRVFGSTDKDDFMQVEPDRLIVPPALELVALQFATTVTPNKDGDVNPYKSSLQPSVVANLGAAAGGSDTAWYLVSSDLPPIAHAYLEGYNAPTVQTIEGMNPDAVVMNARHIFGAAAVEFRGSYKNPGQ